MIKKSIDLNSSDNDSKQEKFHDKKTENKVRHHLSDANDLISEQDIKDVRTDVGETLKPSEKLSKEEIKKLEKEKNQHKNDNEVV